MKLSIATDSDPFVGRKCSACKRVIRPRQAVFSSFDDRLEYGNCWLLLHLSCVTGPEPDVQALMLQMATVFDLATDYPDPHVMAYHVLREQILRTKEAFPSAAA